MPAIPSTFDIDILRLTARVLGWLVLLAILVVTVSPIEARPVIADSPNFERLLAYGLLGLFFAMGYPRHIWLVLLVVLATAVGFEAAQYLSPSRHARLMDALVKIGGGVLGIAAGLVVNFLANRLLPS